jgi:hypothetical protein
MGGIDVVHRGSRADAEHLHELDRVGGLVGFVENPAAAG